MSANTVANPLSSVSKNHMHIYAKGEPVFELDCFDHPAGVCGLARFECLFETSILVVTQAPGPARL